jgi:hypothetical protein
MNHIDGRRLRLSLELEPAQLEGTRLEAGPLGGLLV